ncbi:MAG TPA: PQQ-dependent dehydrogenase, methanol/ethanol family [Gammaproteobacteria bacterium]|jgi:quinohemoprotein ethanol dehydrogenase
MKTRRMHGLTLLLAGTVLSAVCWSQGRTGFADVDQERLLRADTEPENWMTWGRTYTEQRFSPLDQINDENIGELGLAWYFDLNTDRAIEGTPLVIDGVMYLTSAWSLTYALDAATGELIWAYDPEVPPEWGGNSCCGVGSRGLAAWEGRIVIATLDGRLIALDAANGEPIWSTQTFSKDWPYAITGAPRIFDGRVLIGNGGGELGVRGYVTAYDVDTGEQLWRFYTVPGNPADGFESEAMAMAAETWNGEWWKWGGGGTAWDSIVYDPELDYIYIGVGNGSPWVQEYRSPGGGDNLFLASIVAVEAATGDYVWHYQQVPGEQWDFTATQPMILADLTIDGRERQILMQAPKNAFFYVLDRVTGELISAEEFAPNFWASHVDLATGRPVINPEAFYDTEPVLMTPSPPGAHNWQPMSYSPLTGLVYFPAQEVWMPYARDPNFPVDEPRGFRIGNGWGGAIGEAGMQAMAIAGQRARGWLTAWDPVRQREAWRVDYSGTGSGGVLATAGNLVVQGTVDDTVAIYRADNGEKLWEALVNTEPAAGPISYAVNGEQYIAVNAGMHGMARGFGGGPANRADGRVLAFRLGGTATLPPLAEAVSVAPPPPVPDVGPDVIALGNAAYHRVCAGCHGMRVVGGGIIPDLRYMSAATHAEFDDIVLRGSRTERGMIGFDDDVTVEEAEAIRAFVILRANEDWAGE